MPINACPSCGFTHSWALRRGKRKCARCRREFPGTAYPVPSIRASVREWEACVRAFLRRRTIAAVVEDSGLSHHLAERMLMELRVRMSAAPLPVFSGPVEMDETYIGGQRKNKRLHIRRVRGKTGHGTDKLPIFGAFDRATGKVLVAVEPRKLDLQFIIRTLKERSAAGAAVYTDGFKMYRQLPRHGFRHEWVDHDGDELVRGDVHTNNIEGFWGIMKRQMGCIGGMRRKYLHLFVGEIAWKFNHRELPRREREKALMRLVRGR